MAKFEKEQISLRWYLEGNDPYLNTNKPEVYWFVENGIKREFDSLEAMKAALPKRVREAKKEESSEEIQNHKLLSPEKKEALRAKFRKEWEQEQEARKARIGFIVEKKTGGKKIYNREDGYIETFPVIGLEDLKELRATFKKDSKIPETVISAAYRTWGELIQEFTYEDWLAEIQSQIEERTRFEYVPPRTAVFKMRSYPIMEDFNWDDYRPWDKYPWAVLDHLYCAANHIDEEEVMVDAYKLDPAEFYCKWGFQVSRINLPERRKLTPSMLLKYEDCRGIMHMTLKMDQSDFYGKEASYSKIQFDEKTGNCEYL